MSEGGPVTPADFAGQLRAAADRIMAGWTAAAGGAAASTPRLPGVPARPSMPAMPAMPSMPSMPAMPATMSTRQMEAFLDDVAARRDQVQALITQLQGFDEQLGTLEASVRPFVEWTKTWAELEKAMGEFWRPRPGGAGP